MLQRLGQEFLPVEDVKREGDLEAQSREESHYVPWAAWVFEQYVCSVY